jgi:DNA invertase Pin-like site-specific DNA recombinase
MAVFGYIRVSTDRQADEGESLGTQQRQIQGYALQHGWDLAEIHVERGVSGSMPLAERPEGRRLLARLQPGDTVITPKLDRMFRSALNALDVLQQLQARQISLHMIDLGGDVTGNGVSKLVFTILSAVAEAERDRIRERIRDVKRDQAKRGRFLGGTRAPFGYTAQPDDGDAKGADLVEDLAEQEALATMRRLRAEGRGYQAIATAVAEAHGITLHRQQVKRILEAAGQP